MIDLMNYFDPLSIEEPPFPYFAEKARFQTTSLYTRKTAR